MKLKLFRLPKIDKTTPVGLFYNVDYTHKDKIAYEERDRLYLDVRANTLTLSLFDDPYDDDELYRPLDLQGMDRLYKYSDVLTLYAYLHKEYDDIEPFYVFMDEMLYEIKDLLPKDFL